MPPKVLFLLTCIFLVCAYAEPIKPIEFPDSIKSSIPKGSTGNVRIRAQYPTDNIFCDGEYLGSGSVRISLDTGTHSLKVQRKEKTTYTKEATLEYAKKYDIKLWDNQRSKLLTVGVGGIIVSDKRDGTHYHPIVQAELGFFIRDAFMHGLQLQFDPLHGSWKDTTNGQAEMYYRGAYYQLEKKIPLPKNFSLHLGLKGGIGMGKDKKSYADSLLVHLFERPENFYDKIDPENDPYVIQKVKVTVTDGANYGHWGGPSIRLLWGKDHFNIQAMYSQSYGFNDILDYQRAESGDMVAYIHNDEGELEPIWYQYWYTPWNFSIAHNFSVSLALLF